MVNNSGLLIANSYFKLTHIFDLHFATWLGTFPQYNLPILLLSVSICDP